MKIKYEIKKVDLLLFLFSAIIFFSCKGKEGEEESYYFSFDKSKIGIEVVDQELGIKFNPPSGWNLRQTLTSKKIESRGGAVNPNDNFVYHPIYVFFNDSTSGLLSVGKVVTNDSTLTKSAQLNYYKGLIKTKYQNQKLSTGNFLNSKIYFTQFRFQKETLVSFKLVFENTKKEIIQFDYTIPSNYLEGMTPFIKSSVGTIKLF
jgi:hypothetical protein